MALFLVAVLLLLIALLGGWVYRLHAENMNVRAESESAWRELALKLSEDQRDAANRLMVKNGIAPTPKDEVRPAVPDLSPDLSDEQWAALDERQEIEERAREALSDPLQAKLLEDAAKYDPMWAAVRDRYQELKRAN